MVDTLSIRYVYPVATFRYRNFARIGVSPRGTSTHFRHYRAHIRTDNLDTRRHQFRTPRPLELDRRTRYLTLEFSSSVRYERSTQVLLLIFVTRTVVRRTSVVQPHHKGDLAIDELLKTKHCESPKQY